MFRRSFTTPRISPVRLWLTIAAVACLGGLVISLFRLSVPAVNSVGATGITQNSRAKRDSPLQLSNEKAREYLEQTGEGQSLMQALTVARFGLKWEERSPFGSPTNLSLSNRGGGYLGMSHDQNLNVWFDEAGATIRPTVPEKERAKAWQLSLRLKAYGHGEQLQAAPPVVARNVKDNRIEYERANCQLPIANCRFKNAVLADSAFGIPQSPFETFRNGQTESDELSIFQSAIGNRKSAIAEWYENRAEGIEQGFTIKARPERSAKVGTSEPLRVSLGVEGDLRARVKDEAQQIEFVDKSGKGALSYSKLVAQDADGKRLAARMEASADGREIALVVEDEGARYPIVIDPIVATLEKKLEAELQGGSGYRERDARFGAAVAIDGDRAVVGAWRQDNVARVDAGAVYLFIRSGTSWSAARLYIGDNAGDGCGQSVAISDNRIVYGCPGAFNNTGRAFLDSNGNLKELNPPSGFFVSGDRYGASVGISGNNIIVGAPGTTYNGNKTGALEFFKVNSDGSVRLISSHTFALPTALETGTSVAIDGNTVVAGAPGGEVAFVYTLDSTGSTSTTENLSPTNGVAGDKFGSSVAISGNTAVIGAPLNSNAKGTNAGAAYVFVRDTSGSWSQQQKLTASDGQKDAYFSASAVAIQGNTIVVGSYAWFSFAPFFGVDLGKAYVFMRNGTVWTEQTTMVGDNNASDQFGIGVGISGNSVIAGARAATASGVARAGAAYVYRLDCVPPRDSSAVYNPGGNVYFNSLSICPGRNLAISSLANSATNASLSYQWRKNGVNIPGATGFTYNINAASASDAGSYDVIVSNSCGSDISTPFSLTVYTFSLSPTNGNFGAGGSDGSVSVTSTGSCFYTAVPSASWIKITSNGSGTPPQNIGFHVDPNTGPNQRTGTITIGDKTFTVTQDGLNCSYAIAPTSQSFTASSGANIVSVTATAGCAWTTVNNSPSFITITSGGSGNGNGTVNYSVAANSTANSRTGTITIAGQTFTVTQAGLSCSYSIAPTAQSFGASGGSNSVNVTTQAGCAWTATSNAGFINVTSGASGTGNGIVNYSVATNTGLARTGTLTIAGTTFTVTQDGPLVVLTADQVTLKSWIYQGRSYAYVRLSFPDAGYRVANWGQVVRSANDFTADASVERLIGPSVQAVTTTAQIYDLGPLTDGNYTFTFKNSGVVVKSLAFTVSSATPTPNPIDTAREFVRQQYRDFLNREADQAGEDFWTDNITKCSDPARRPAGQTEAQCTLRQRETTSGAFFLSPEFQYTGYFVYRMYQGALGRQPKLSEFIPDAQFVGAGILVNGQLSAAKINQNKADFAAQFVNCTDAARYRCGEFKAIYDGLNNQAYVDKLFQTTGVNASASDRLALVNGLNGGSETRASVLHKVVDGIVVIAEGNQQFTTTYGQAFYTQESNRAFVQLEYFGYMKRDPDDAGYAFWLGKLNQFGGNFVNAEMVLAFISSPEYRARFGQP